MARAGGLGRRIGRGIGWLLLAAVVAVLALQLWFLAHVVWYKYHEPTSTAFMRAQLAVLREQDPKAGIRYTWTPYARISPHLKRAVIASEDANFTEHDGVDWEAIERAHERNLKRGKVTHGGSTITMQLAKNLFLSGERSYLRKAQELVITFMLEAVLSKQRILELYLNVAEWGTGVFGCEAAAQRWYRSSADRLGPGQAARLAAMLPRPRYYDRNPGSSTLARRAETIQRWMGSISPP
ncbi:MAG: monofunctional biosynthetic peptidoglycan transglycosylase [Burkholderiales bacterium]|nr:MAG: monofunctional biosynthetic peptidoglycan transglycosylase [Burkholderiales bacterium]